MTFPVARDLYAAVQNRQNRFKRENAQETAKFGPLITTLSCPLLIQNLTSVTTSQRHASHRIELNQGQWLIALIYVTFESVIGVIQSHDITTLTAFGITTFGITT